MTCFSAHIKYRGTTECFSPLCDSLSAGGNKSASVRVKSHRDEEYSDAPLVPGEPALNSERPSASFTNTLLRDYYNTDKKDLKSFLKNSQDFIEPNIFLLQSFYNRFI